MEKTKMRVSELEVETFEPVEREEVGIAVMDISSPEPCGDSEDIWECASYENCHQSHPYQKVCM
ncbi:MAG TPA: hypothetical protein VGB15_06565 [Longimicrobium sp.]|jgi:hypothetical protein